jgi:hypothetical protein
VKPQILPFFDARYGLVDRQFSLVHCGDLRHDSEVSRGAFHVIRAGLTRTARKIAAGEVSEIRVARIGG